MLNQFNFPHYDYDALLYKRREAERRQLRKDLSYIGVLSITLTMAFRFGFSLLVVFLVWFGLLTPDQLQLTNLGLDNTSYLVLYAFVYATILLVPALVVSLCFKKRHMPFSPARPVSFPVTFLCIIGSVGLCMLANIINSYFLAFFSELGLSVPEPPQTLEPTFISLFLNLFTMSILPALLEEMIYRGYILRVLRPYGDGFAVIVSSLLFSLMHGNLRQIPFAFFVGLVLGLLYVVTNNIWISIAVHLANNALSVLMEYFSFGLSEAAVGAFYAVVIYGFAVVGLVALLLLIKSYGRNLRIARTNSLLSFRNRAGALVTTPMFIAAVGLYILLLLTEI